jgi:hypothetical protein
LHPGLRQGIDKQAARTAAGAVMEAIDGLAEVPAGMGIPQAPFSKLLRTMRLNMPLNIDRLRHGCGCTAGGGDDGATTRGTFCDSVEATGQSLLR